MQFKDDDKNTTLWQKLWQMQKKMSGLIRGPHITALNVTIDAQEICFGSNFERGSTLFSFPLQQNNNGK